MGCLPRPDENIYNNVIDESSQFYCKLCNMLLASWMLCVMESVIKL